MTSTSALKQAVVGVLTANLPALVAAQSLPPINEFLGYEPGLLSPAKAPQVWVTLAEQLPGGPAGFGGANASHTRTRRVLVGVTVADNAQSEVEDRLLAYADLIQALLISNPTMGGQASQIRWKGTAYGANMSRSLTALHKQAVLTFDLDRWSVLGED